MESMIFYWYWLVFGMVLVIAEMFIPSFTIFWFGLGAIIVGGILCRHIRRYFRLGYYPF